MGGPPSTVWAPVFPSLSAWFLSVGEGPVVTGQPPSQAWVSMVTDASSQAWPWGSSRGLCQGALGHGWVACFMVRHLLFVPSHCAPAGLAF